MRKLSLFIFAVMFLANTVVVSAWAKPCLMNAPVQMSLDMDASMSDDMPCHEEQNEQKNTHCDGICLCVHASVSQTLIMTGDVGLNMPPVSSDHLMAENETMASRTTSPPYRPPITHS